MDWNEGYAQAQCAYDAELKRASHFCSKWERPPESHGELDLG